MNFKINLNLLKNAITEEDIRRKINGLRTQYNGEKNKVLKIMVSGAGAGDIYTPTLWCYELLRFLYMGNPVRESRSNLDEDVFTEASLAEETRPDEKCVEVIFEGAIEQLNTGNILVEDDIEKEEQLNAFSPDFEDEVFSPTSRRFTPSHSGCGVEKKIKKIQEPKIRRRRKLGLFNEKSGSCLIKV